LRLGAGRLVGARRCSVALLRSGVLGRSRCRVSPVELSHQLAVGLAGAVEVFGCAPECVVELADVGLEGVDLLAE